MAVIDLKARQGGGTTGDFELLETDVYRMKVADVKLEEDQFADAAPDGTRPVKVVIRWEVTEAGEDQDDDIVGRAVWQRFNPYYGDVRDGGPSKFKAFIDGLREQGLLPEFDPSMFDTALLAGLEQKVSVEKYIKTMGKNAGQPGNKVVSVMPLRRTKKATKAAKPSTPDADEDPDLPF